MINRIKHKYSKKKDGIIRPFDFQAPSMKLAYSVISVVCIVGAICFLFPVVWVFMSGFKEVAELNSSTKLMPNTVDFQSLVDTWNKTKFFKYYIHSFIVTGGSVIFAVLVNGMTAYALTILKPKGCKIVQGLIYLCLMIPSTGSIVALYVNICKLGMTNSYVPLWLAAGSSAFNVIMFMNFFKSIPADYLDAARLDGCGNFRMFLDIVLPLSKPIVMVIVIFTITNTWSDFLLPFLVLNNSGKETVMVRLFQMQSWDGTTNVMMLRAILFSIIPPTIFFLFFQRKITDSVAGEGGIKG